MLEFSRREFTLAGPHGDGQNAYANRNGAFLGCGVPLLERDAFGHWKPRSKAELEALLSRGYGVPIELGWRERQLQYVAQALNKNDIALACLSLLRMELPPLPSADQARAMAAADGFILKYNPDWGNEPRVAAGGPDGGQWTAGGGDPASPAHGSPLSPANDAPLTPVSDRPPHYKPVPGLPKNAVKVTLSDGTVIKDPQSSTGALMAPPYADYRQVYAAGQAIAGDNFSRQIAEIRAAVRKAAPMIFNEIPFL